MENMQNYATGLLSLAYILITSDGEISENELKYLEKIKNLEGLTEDHYHSFRLSLVGKKEREIYQAGIEAINRCTDKQKLSAFVRLYQMADADGVIHVKEVRLLLYAVKSVDVDINQVIEHVKAAA